MNLLLYILVFVASFLVDVIPFVGPPAWTVMVFLQARYNLDIWTVLAIGVPGSALGRYVYSLYVRRLSTRYVKEEKNGDWRFVGTTLGKKGWRVQLFVLLYTLTPVPTTPLFTASGVAGIRPLHIMPAFLTGKFASDALMISAGNYLVKNASALSQKVVGWQGLLGTAVALLLVALFFFVDWQTLLLRKKLRFAFHIWK